MNPNMDSHDTACMKRNRERNASAEWRKSGVCTASAGAGNENRVKMLQRLDLWRLCKFFMRGLTH